MLTKSPGLVSVYVISRAIGNELDAVVAEFDALTKKELTTVNAALQNKKLDPITLLTKVEWEKKQEKD